MMIELRERENVYRYESAAVADVDDERAPLAAEERSSVGSVDVERSLVVSVTLESVGAALNVESRPLTSFRTQRDSSESEDSNACRSSSENSSAVISSHLTPVSSPAHSPADL